MPINGLTHRLHLFWQYSITLLIGALIALHVMQPVQADEEAHGNRFIVLCYHDVQDELTDHAPRYTIKTSDPVSYTHLDVYKRQEYLLYDPCYHH